MSVKSGGCYFSLLLILTGLGSARADISDLRRCADPECKEPISKGRTMIGYPSSDKQILSFPINAEVTVYSKEAGSRKDLWGVEIKGKRGYVPKQYIREQKIFVSKLKYEVPTEGSSDTQNSAQDVVNIDDVKESPKKVNDPDLTEAQKEHQLDIALSAEDVEYNNLQRTAEKKEEDAKKPDVKDNLEEEINDESDVLGDTEEIELLDGTEEEEVEKEEEEEEEEGKDEEEEGEEEEEEQEQQQQQQQDASDVEEEHDAEESNKESDAFSDDITSDDVIDDSQEASEMQPLNREKDEEHENSKGNSKDRDNLTSIESSKTSGAETPSSDEPSPSDYEVIDGTTLYFDDATPLPPTAEVAPPVNLMSSSATNEDYITAHPPPLLSQASYGNTEDEMASIQVTATVDPESSTLTVVESGSESVFTEGPVEPTETLPSGKESTGNVKQAQAEQSIEPATSWLSEATASVSSWFGKEENGENEASQSEADKDIEPSDLPLSGTDDDGGGDDDKIDENDDFGLPKSESIVDSGDVIDDDEQNEGFFSSWFSSPEAPKEKEIEDNVPGNLDTTKSDEPVEEEAEVGPDSISEESSTKPSKTDPVDNLVPSDTMQTPVEQTENPEVFTQPLYVEADVDNAYNTQHSLLPSVDTIPETPSTPDLDPNPENPLDHGEVVSVEEPSSDLSTTSLSDQVDLADDKGMGSVDDDGDGDTSFSSNDESIAENSVLDRISNAGDLSSVNGITTNEIKLGNISTVANCTSDDCNSVDDHNESYLHNNDNELNLDEIDKSRISDSSDKVADDVVIDPDSDESASKNSAVDLDFDVEELLSNDSLDTKIDDGIMNDKEDTTSAIGTDVKLSLETNNLSDDTNKESDKLLGIKSKTTELHSSSDHSTKKHVSDSLSSIETLEVNTETSVDVDVVDSPEIVQSDSAVTSTEIREQADITSDSDVVDPRTSPSDDDDDDDPGTSTARPLYAVPEPSSQDYHPDNHVDPDDLSRIAGKGEVMDGSESSNGEADASLSEGLLKTSHNLLPEGLAFGFEAELAEPQVSNGMLIFLLIVSGTVVTIYFVHLISMKISREAPLLAALNRLDHENRVKADENESLHAELVKARAELENVSARVTTSSGDVDDISSQLEMVKNEYASEKSQLEERVVQLEHELEEATTNGLEMHKMLSEMLSAEKDASAFQASVDHLQSMLDGQQEKVETLTSDLALKNRLNEELHSELSSSMERASKLDYQVEQLTHSLEELTGVKGEAIRKLQEEAAVVEELKEANASLTKQTGEYDSQVTSLTSELSDLRETINQLRESVETKESELQVAKECLKQLRLTSAESAAPDEEKLSALFDVIRVKAELHKVNSDRLTLVEQLQDAEMAQKNLEEAMSSIRTEVTELRTHHDVAIREKQEAMSKLEVLTKYFEEKEAQLTKELESQEGLRVNAEGSAAAVAKKIQNYDLELASYKTQVESLRKELEEQESSYKAQIASHEQKAHDNWLQARSSERKHDEQRQENSQLRSRLTMMQKEREEVQQSQVNIIKPTPKRVDANGTMSSPRPMVDGVDGDHSGPPPPLHCDLDSPPLPPPHPMHGPPMLPMMFPPGGPLPPGVPPPHGLPPGVPPPPPGMPHGVPPPHGLPPHPFLPGEPPFMGPIPPLPGDRRLPPAGGMSSPPFRRCGSPSYDHRNDRYSPLSDRSHISDRRYSPPPLRRRPLSPDMHRNRSPDRRSDRTRSPDRRSDRMMRSPDHRNERRSPDRRSDRRSPDRHYTRSPDGYMRHRNSPRNHFDEPDFNNEDSRLRSHIKGKKTSTPLGPNDR